MQPDLTSRWMVRDDDERAAGLVTAWVEPRVTGRNPLDVSIAGTGGMRGQRLSIARQVTTADAWTRSRYDLSVFLLRDVGAMTAAEAHRAALVALVIWSHATAQGLHEYNWNVGYMGCDINQTARCMRINLTVFAGINAFASYGSLVDAVRVWWNRPWDWGAFKRGDLNAVVGWNAVSANPMTLDQMRSELARLSAMIPAPAEPGATPPRTTPRTTPRGGGGGGGATPEEPADPGGDVVDPLPELLPVARRKKGGGVVLVAAVAALFLLARR